MNSTQINTPASPKRVRTRAVWCAVAALAFLGSSALAQIVPPAPPKSPPAPEYVPPPPPPTPSPRESPTPVRPTEDGRNPDAPAKPLPSLLQKDSAGKIKPLTMPIDEAAVRALELSEAAKPKLDAAMIKRRTEVGRVIVENLADLIEIRTTMATANESTSLETMASTAQKTKPFRAVPLVDFLVKEGALTPAQKTQATQVAREYKGAIREEAMNSSGGHGNMNAMAFIGFKFTMDDFSGEAFRELDRVLDDSAPKADAILKGMNLPAGHAAAKRLGELSKPPAGKSKSDVVKSIFFDALSVDEKKTYLLAAKPELKRDEAAADPAANKTPEEKKPTPPTTK